MRIITSSNPGYFGRIEPYLQSLWKHSQIPSTLVCVGEKHCPFSLIETKLLSRDQNQGVPPETECAQHGSFLQVVKGDPNETLIFTDGDIILQRPFTQAELDWLADFPADTIAAGYNSGPQESLYVQGTMIQPLVDMLKVQKRYGPILQRSIGYNVGVFIARRATYQKLYDLYMPQWEEVCGYFHHAARQQWLMNLVIAQNFTAVLTPYSFHANGHFGMPPGCGYKDGLLYAGDELVAFRHKL